MSSQTDVYNRLAERWGAPGSTRFSAILELLMTPEDGSLLLELPVWTTSQQLAERLNTDEQGLRNKLEDMAKRRVIRSGKYGYAMPPNIMNLCHMTVNSSPRSDELWTDFFFEEWRYMIADQQHKRRLTGSTNYQLKVNIPQP